MNDTYADAFKKEARELLGHLEDALLSMVERRPRLRAEGLRRAGTEDTEGVHTCARLCQKKRSGYFWLMAERRQELLPTGLVKVQYSSNFTGSLLLPATTAPVVSSVV